MHSDSRTANSPSKSFSTAGFWSIAGSPRVVNNFNPGWRFLKADAAGAEQPDFDDSGWEAAHLPHGLEILGENASGGRNYQGIAWYRKRFTAPRNAGKAYLYFEAAMGHAQVWVNGTQVMEHFGGYLPFAAEISALLHHDRANVVAVKVNNADDKLYPPGKPQGNLDFTYLGGIYRNVYLIETGDIHVTLPEVSDTVAGAGVFAATLDVNGSSATMAVRTEVSNTTGSEAEVVIRTTLETAAHDALTSFDQNITLAAEAAVQTEHEFTVDDVHLWHPDDPCLHFIKTEILHHNVVVDSMRTRIGIRLFEMRGSDGLYINKQRFNKLLIGVNRHQDYHYVGNALPNSGQWRDAKLLREGGSNVVRAAHYPLAPAFYDACDELGLLATTANPGWQFFNFEEAIFEQRLYEDTRNLVRRDRHVASMLMWETAINETPTQPGHVMNRMHTIAHEEYPFPGLYTVADCDEAKAGGLDLHYHGRDPDVNSFNREYGDGGEVDNFYSQNARTRVPLSWGEHALLQQSLIQAGNLSSVYQSSGARLGGTLWCGIDHQRGYHNDPFWGGLLNGLRLPRYTWYLYQSQYAPDYQHAGITTGPMLFITNELTQVSSPDVVIYSNVDEVRLTWLGETVGVEKPSRDEQFAGLPHPPFIFKNAFDFTVISKDFRRKTRDLEMVAEGLINGEVVITVRKPYAEVETGIQLSVAHEGLGLTADGSDFIPVRAEMVDRDGARKVLSKSPVYFTIEGAGELIGDGATLANPVYPQMGVATALVRSLPQAGEITVHAHSPRLQSASLTLTSAAAPLPLYFDEAYTKASLSPEQFTVLIQHVTADHDGADVAQLQEELRKLRNEVTSKEQDIMELRSRLGQ